MEWPALAKETTKICEDLGVEDCNLTRTNKIDYKEIVMQACHRKNESKLLSMAEGKIKCDKMTKEKYEKKEYII